MMDQLTIIRSVDARHQQSRAEPGLSDGQPRGRAARQSRGATSIRPSPRSSPGTVAAANRAMPPSVVLNMKSRSHVAWGGYLGKQYDPFLGNQASSCSRSAAAVSIKTAVTRGTQRCRNSSTGCAATSISSGSMAADGSLRAAGRRHRRRPAGPARPSTLARARGSARALRQPHLVPAGAAGPAARRGGRQLRHDRPEQPRRSGTWDTHGDNIPPYGGIWNGLRPLLPVFDHLLTTLVGDLDERGLLDDVLVIAMGEFGRTPQLGTQGSTDGRNHWPVVMSMTLAGGGLRHGQVIGATERDGGADQGAARHARRPGGHDLSPHGRAAGRHLSRRPRPPALLSSNTASRSASCSDAAPRAVVSNHFQAVGLPIAAPKTCRRF